jgi:type II secretory pathway pseudopilin PulG
MRRREFENKAAGFTLIEILVGIVVLGFVLISFATIFALYQKGATRSGEYQETQQNARIALDYVTDHLRQAGAQVDYFKGQRPIAYAGPYQVVVNADVDNGRTIDGNSALLAIKVGAPNGSVPPSGTVLYAPTETYDSEAETYVFTLDSNRDGLITSSDRGDDPEETGLNRNLFVMKMYVYGDKGGGVNEVRESNVAIVRGPNLGPTWNTPDPLFQYSYDHDDDPTTRDRLWGDTNLNGELETAEISAIKPIPQSALSRIRKVKVTTIGESTKYDKRYETNGGFMNITMTSEISIRNVSLTSSMIRGKVFHDINEDGVMDHNETGIPDVEIRLAGQGRSVITDKFGMFFIPLPAGKYSVQEVDPPGYKSTTSNLLSVTLASGQTAMVNFGDLSDSPFGIIRGVVYEDMDKDGHRDFDEAGIPGVLVSLDDGAQTNTDDVGFYSFVAQQGNYMVVETDPPEYSSTTPNGMPVTILSMGDTVTVNFGDYMGPTYGTLEGYVFLDINEDGVRNYMEEGLPNVTIRVSSGDSTITNSSGQYRFNLSPGTYSVVEVDPVGYTSTTVNKYTDIPITADTTVVRDFGDILEERTDFVEIHISNTERVLSVTTTNLREDGMGDADIVLGTALTGETGNMLIFHNNWESSTTPLSELFDSDPSYRREAGSNISALVDYDFSRDGVADVLSGTDNSTEPNIQLWFTAAGGILATSPSTSYHTTGVNEVMDATVADFDLDGTIDILVALKSPFGTSGAVETFRGDGWGTFSSWSYITHAGVEGDVQLGQVWAVDAGDIDGDGDADVVVGSHVTDYTGYIDVYINTGYATGAFKWVSRYQALGAVNDIKLVDMKEDDAGDPDIVAAVTRAANVGLVILWSNTYGEFGLPDTTGHDFGDGVMPHWPDDWVDALGEALSLAILYVNNDVFPDVAYGTRNSSLYTGDLYILPAYGTLPVGGTKINKTVSGEIISIDVADFNKDSRPDIVVGTRSSATQGRLVAYFGREL